MRRYLLVLEVPFLCMFNDTMVLLFLLEFWDSLAADGAWWA